MPQSYTQINPRRPDYVTQSTNGHITQRRQLKQQDISVLAKMFDPFKHGVLYMGHIQQSLISVFNHNLNKNGKEYHKNPKNGYGMVLLLRVGNSIRLNWIKYAII